MTKRERKYHKRKKLCNYVYAFAETKITNVCGPLVMPEGTFFSIPNYCIRQDGEIIHPKNGDQPTIKQWFIPDIQDDHV